MGLLTSETNIIDEDIIRAMVNKIVAEINPLKILLFGSYARNNAGPNSDIDFLIVVDADKSEWRRIAVKIRIALNEFDISKDIVVTNPETLEKRKNDWWTIYCPALREGIIAYEK